MDKDLYLHYLELDNYIPKSSPKNIENNSIQIGENIIFIIDENDFNNHSRLLQNICLSLNIDINKIHIAQNFYNEYLTLDNKVLCIWSLDIAQDILNTHSLRNNIHQLNSNKIIVTFDLEYLSKNPLEKQKTWLDLIMLKNLASIDLI